jgi:hypothetical protein
MKGSRVQGFEDSSKILKNYTWKTNTWILESWNPRTLSLN